MSARKINLKGITWDHSRGLSPLVATSQRFSELHPEVEISWEKRSLQEFADKPLDKLITAYDLLVIDHPWVGHVAKKGSFLSLDTYLSSSFMKDQALNSVGSSFESYRFNDQSWALAIDVATPVASSRSDILRRMNRTVPGNRQELISLADEGCVVFPAIPIDSLMNFYMLCLAFGEQPFTGKREVVSKETGLKALGALRSLAQKVDRACFNWNPIRVYEAMTQTDDYAYCPFAYAYVNYTRKGYAPHPLNFHDLVTWNTDKKLISTLGGTGLAVSKACQHADWACSYLEYVASADIQSSIYFESGGQPGHLEAWKKAEVNGLSRDFFKETLPAHQRAYLRPRYAGYIYFQDYAGYPVREYMMNGGAVEAVLEKINSIYTKSLS